MNKIFTILCFLIIINSCDNRKQQSTSTFEVSYTINKEVESKISKSDFGNSAKDAFEIYNNTLIADLYENDSLVMSTKMEKKQMPFKSFYYSRNDTLTIDGAYGIFGGFGFSIEIVEGIPIVYHMAAGDNNPIFSMSKDGELEFRIEVPCAETKLTISNISKPKEEKPIYGVVEFKSNEYYQSGPIVQGKEIEDRTKIRMNMTIYFKSNYLDLDKM